MASPYSDGTVSVTAGLTTVTGAGTAWALSLVTGGLFCADGVSIPIASVTDDDTLVLDIPWPGSSQSGMEYSIFRETSAAADAIEANDRLADVARRLRSGTFLQPNATGTLSERAQWDSEAQGFIYVQSDVDPFLVYIKESDGDWSTGQPLRGGDGEDGEPGPPGVGDFYDVPFEIVGRPGAGEEFRALFVRTVVFPASFSGSRAKANAASTGAAVVSIKKNGSEVGTITFTNSSTGVFAGSGATFNADDILSFESPDPANATLSGILITLAGTRSA